MADLLGRQSAALDALRLTAQAKRTRGTRYASLLLENDVAR